jgi:hypothetical protein
MTKFNTCADLKIAHNKRFINLAYLIMLGREAEKAVLDNCRTSGNAAEMLDNIRHSEEGRLYAQKYSHIVFDAYQTASPEQLANLTPRARDIYHKLKVEIALNKRGAV